MTPFSPDEMRKVAEHVYPGCTVRIADGGVYYAGFLETAGHFVGFSPSLTGTEREKSQALDCIVAAFKLLDCNKLDRFIFDPVQNGYIFSFNNGESYIQRDDILAASIAALLAEGEGV